MTLLVTLFLVFLPNLYAFDCTYFGTDNSMCSRFSAQGCTWDGTSCSGAFAYTSCTGTCRYVDSEGPPGSTGPTADNPYLTLTDALAASTTPSTIYLWNNYPGKVFKMTAFFKTSAAITIEYSIGIY